MTKRGEGDFEAEIFLICEFIWGVRSAFCDGV